MEDKKKMLLRGKKKLGKPVFNNILYGWFSAWGCFPGRELDTTLRGKNQDSGQTAEDATLSDGDKNTP